MNPSTNTALPEFAAPNSAFTETSDLYAFPCTVAQKGFWLLDQLRPGNSACNIAVRFQLRGPVSVPLIEKSFNEMVRRHESLRTRIVSCHGDPVQVVEPGGLIRVFVHDLSSLSEPARTSESERLTIEEAQKEFDLRHAPLLRVGLLKLEPELHILLVTTHHAISDGWSVGIITNELAAIYETLALNKPPLPELPIQFADFAIWENDYLSNGLLNRQLAYWKQKLDGINTLELSTDHPRPAAQTFNGDIKSILLPRALTNGLAELSRRHDCTLFMVMLAAFKTLLYRWTGQTDIVIGTLISGRNLAELEPLIGVFINSLVLRTDVSMNPPFTELLGRVKQTVLEAFEHQDLPFERLVTEIRAKRDARRHPVFQVDFIYQRDFVKPVQFAGIELTALPSKAAGSIYDLNFFMVERADGWRASVEYNTDLYRPETIQRLLQQFQTVLEEASCHETRRLCEFTFGDINQAPTLQQHVPVASSIPGYIAPRNDTESRLAEIWEKIIGVNPISVTANFFDAGGHSLLAAKLLSQVDLAFGKRIPLADFFEASSIEKMASLLGRQTSATRSSVIAPIQPTGTKPPLFIIHGVGGTILTLAPLLRHLSPDQPVYAVQSAEPASDTPLLARVEDMAAHYIQEIRKIQPQGPYYLLGHSAGGMTAFEMAQQFQMHGEQVGFLGMLDTYQLDYFRQAGKNRSLCTKLGGSARLIGFHLGNTFRSGGFSYLKQRMRSKYLRLLYWFCQRTNRPVPALPDAIENLNWFAVRNYKVEPYNGSLFLFRATDRAEDAGYDYLLGWGGYAKQGITVYDIPGSHEKMSSEPNVQILADRLTACLGRTQSTDFTANGRDK